MPVDGRHVPCGRRSLAAERFLEEHPNIMRLLTPESVYVVRKSQYNPAARSMNVGSITRRSTLLDVGGSRNLEEEKRTLHAMLDKANEARCSCLRRGPSQPGTSHRCRRAPKHTSQGEVADVQEKDRAQEELRDLEKDTKQEERRAAAITAEINRITTAAQAARNRLATLHASEACWRAPAFYWTVGSGCKALDSPLPLSECIGCTFRGGCVGT